MQVLLTTKDNIQAALNILHEGGIVTHATETCYGLACDMSNPEAVAKLFAIKHRPDDMPISALFASIDQAKDYLEWNDLAEELANRHLPGPLTLILKQKPDALKQLSPTTSCQLPTPNIGLRISSHPTAQALVEAFSSPISTTSANLHGKPNPYRVEDIEAEADLILDDGVLEGIEASTVVDVSEGKLKVLRAGNITF